MTTFRLGDTAIDFTPVCTTELGSTAMRPYLRLTPQPNR
jgi:hypothetical protein